MKAPTYKPKPFKRPDVILTFFADPFDPRLRTPKLEWTSLGVMAQMYGELRQLLKREAPDILAFIDTHDPD